MKTLAIVPARSGSKGLPGKNIRLLAGKPLLAYSVEAAAASEQFDVVHVSTDSEEYAEIARRCGADVPFLRSAQTATDTASTWDTVLEVLERYEQIGQSFDVLAVLQPTSPLRTAEDIRAGFALMRERSAEAVIAVCEADHSPLWCNTLPEDGCMDGFIRMEYAPRQELPQYYRINGALYLTSVERLRREKTLRCDAGCYAYVMPRERSVDIDGPLDFAIAEAILKNES